MCYEQPKYTPEKDILESCTNATSKSESQVTMLQGQGFSLRTLFNPSALPTRQSASLVSFLVGFLGKSSLQMLTGPTDVDAELVLVCVASHCPGLYQQCET